ncbi:hypothetical protein HPB52_015504 [Rhipicephalus sanguineus]|uniref:Uncharacterized protein n=1 Tax=Rhipicephalus sanguineus TaxID=34632 RepID=A0A9D4PHB8_RHISA|nr:hypothetical protein HPB52_015504 [Rhipicephalus sanguineus]
MTGGALDIPEQETGVQRQHCTSDSLGDVVSALEHARNRKPTAVQVRLDVQSAFGGLPHLVVKRLPVVLGV